jgi:hypothetical protein
MAANVAGMETDATWGIVILGLALGLIVTLVLVSRHRINRIAKRGYLSARQTLKELDR